MYEGMRQELETQIDDLKRQAIAALGNEKLKRDAERWVQQLLVTTAGLSTLITAIHVLPSATICRHFATEF